MMTGEKSAGNDPLRLGLRYICLEAASAMKRRIEAQRESTGRPRQESAGEKQQKGSITDNEGNAGGGGGEGNYKMRLSNFLIALSNKINIAGIGIAEGSKNWIPGVVGTLKPGFAVP